MILNDEVAEAAVVVEEVEIGGWTALRSIMIERLYTAEGENIDPAAITTAAAAAAVGGAADVGGGHLE